MEFRLFLSLSTLTCLFASEWNYEGYGPDYWVHEYPNCAGSLQSPINIKSSQAVYDSNLGHIDFHNYEWILNWNVSNNGHTIIAYQLFNESLTPYITGSDFKTGVKYYLKQFHFHWGFNIYQGSEHHIDNEKFPLEIHLVHGSEFNETTVVSFLFQISEEENNNIKSLVNQIGNEEKISESSRIKFSLNSLLPGKDILQNEGYFRYMGSLTTPPCTEGIKWTVFRTKINISEAQMEEFYKNEIEFNNREIQELNERTLYVNMPENSPSPTNQDEQTTILTFILNLLSILLKLIASLIQVN